MDIDEFLNSGGKTKRFSDWKNNIRKGKGKICFFLLKKGGMYRRLVHRVPYVSAGDGGSGIVQKMKQKITICEDYNCPVCAIVDFCRSIPEDDRAAVDVLAFKVGGKIQTWTAEDIVYPKKKQNWTLR